VSEADPQHRRRQLYALLGDLPDRDRPVSPRLIGAGAEPSYRVERLLLDLNGIEPVPAYFISPATGRGPFPTVLYNHAHGGDYGKGKDEVRTGTAYLQQPPYAEALTALGMAVLCIDHWGFGERRGRTESAIFKHMLWRGQVMWGMMVYDSLRAIDYLVSRPDVDAARIATLGISMGSTMAWWVAALDERVRVCVDLCCLTDFDALTEAGGLDGHGIYYYVPGLLKHFTAAQINALIAPRPHLGLAGVFDPLTPAAGLDRIDAELRVAYRQAGAEGAWRLVRSQTGHFETAAMRAEVLAFLREWL
jgi:dienelactone hydrolase